MTDDIIAFAFICFIGIIFLIGVTLLVGETILLIRDRDMSAIGTGIGAGIAILLVIAFIISAIHSTNVCPVCDTFTFDKQYCPHCGEQLMYEGKVECPNCHANNGSSFVYCSECGENLKQFSKTT